MLGISKGVTAETVPVEAVLGLAPWASPGETHRPAPPRPAALQCPSSGPQGAARNGVRPDHFTGYLIRNWDARFASSRGMASLANIKASLLCCARVRTGKS